MSRISKEVDKLVKLGKGKDEMKHILSKDFAEISVANELKSYPETAEFLKYKKYNDILLGCLGLILLYNCLIGFFSLGFVGVLIPSIVPLLFIYYIKKGKSGAYLWLMITIVGSGSKLAEGIVDIFQEDITIIILTLSYFGVFMLAFGLAFYLRKKLFPGKKST